MDIKELRIENYVSVPHYQGGRVSKKICNLYYDPNTNEQKIAVMYYSQEMFYANYEISQVEPVPLTPELLETAGFEASFHGYKKDGFLFALWHYKDTDGYLVQYNQTEHEVTIIHYVHQLQNLYFALTGKELELSL
jgi:hypothetical protein